MTLRQLEDEGRRAQGVLGAEGVHDGGAVGVEVVVVVGGAFNSIECARMDFFLYEGGLLVVGGREALDGEGLSSSALKSCVERVAVVALASVQVHAQVPGVDDNLDGILKVNPKMITEACPHCRCRSKGIAFVC